eukprot:262382_1
MNFTTINLLDELLTLFCNTHKHYSLYEETVIKLFDRSSKTRLLYKNRGKSSIETFENFITKMHNPYKYYKCIHVGGTNGKGSVSTKLANAFTKIGFNVGLYTSPHISCVRERIQINGKKISEYDFANILQYIFTLEKQLNITLTYFEILNAIAFYYFKQKSVDFALIEVGVGGTYDSTNVIKQPLVSIIVSISLDHTRLLGNTIQQIATDKCGIIKKGIPIIIGPTVPVSIAEEYANKKGGILFKLDKRLKQLTYDEQNIELCKLTLKIVSEYCKLPCEYMDMYKFLDIKPVCRFEERNVVLRNIITDNMVNNYQDVDMNIVIKCVMDVAHNKAGFIEFFKLLQLKFPSNKYLYRFVIGISKHKESVVDIIKATVKVCDYLHLCTGKIKGKRMQGRSTKELYDIITKNTDFDVNKIFFDDNGNVGDAVLNGLYQCCKYNSINDCEMKGKHNGNEDKKKQILCIIGSFYIMAEARTLLMLNDDNDDDFL